MYLGHSISVIVLQIFLVQIHSITGLVAFVAGKFPQGFVGAAAVHDKNDSAIILGGRNSTHELTEIWRFQIPMGEVTKIGDLPLQVGFGSAEIDFHGNVFYFGGFGNQIYFDSVYMLKAGSSEVIQIATLPYPLAQHSSAYDQSEYIYIFGGQAYGIALPSILRFSVVTFETSIVTLMPGNLYGASSTWIGDSAYIFGGVTNSYFTNQIWKYTPLTNDVEVLDSTLAHEVITTSAVSDGTDLYIIGGYPAPRTHHHVTRFDPKEEVLNHFNVTNFPEYLDTTAAIFDANTNAIYTFGGSDMAITRSEIFAIPT